MSSLQLESAVATTRISSRFLEALGLGPEITGLVRGDTSNLTGRNLPLTIPPARPSSRLQPVIPDPEASDDVVLSRDDDDFPALDSLTVPEMPKPVADPSPVAPVAIRQGDAAAPEPAPEVESPAVEAKEEAVPVEEAGEVESKPEAPDVHRTAEPVRLACPSCQAPLALDPAHIGIEGLCPKCDVPLVAYRGAEGGLKVAVIPNRGIKTPLPGLSQGTPPKPAPVSGGPRIGIVPAAFAVESGDLEEASVRSSFLLGVAFICFIVSLVLWLAGEPGRAESSIIPTQPTTMVTGESFVVAKAVPQPAPEEKKETR